MRDRKFSIASPLAAIVITLLICFSAAAQQSSPTANWKTYRGAKFSFRYPPNLSLSVKKTSVELSHSVKFRHTDPCDASDKPKTWDTLEDFHATFKVVRQKSLLLTGDYAKDEWEKTSEGLIDTGNLKGTVALNTAEGCGQYVYSFVAPNDHTLVIERLLISLFQTTAYQNGDAERALKLKNVISRERENQLFKAIVETIKFK